PPRARHSPPRLPLPPVRGPHRSLPGADEDGRPGAGREPAEAGGNTEGRGCRDCRGTGQAEGIVSEPLKPPFTYFGGKLKLAERIAALLPSHQHYVEPF